MFSSQLRAIVDTAVDGIVLINAGGRVTMFNRACEQIFGYAAAEILGGDVKQLMPTPYANEHDQYLLNYQQSGQKKIIGIGRQVVGRRKSGETFPMDLSVGEVPGAGEVAYVGILRDVTERVRADEQRERLIEQLARSNADQTHFVHAASHDLREPSRMITAFGGRLARDYGDQLDARGAEYLRLVVGAGEHMGRLLDDLIDFARLATDSERGRSFDTTAVFERVIEGLSESIERTEAEISHGGLPHVTANPVRFERLLQNLIGNALKYVGEGIRPRIKVEAEREGGCWRFSVSDNGIGIDARYFERIFEPFKRLHARGHYDGTGLGLAICRKITEGFGGAITVRSSEGQGSTFSFTIPVERDTDDVEKHDP